MIFLTFGKIISSLMAIVGVTFTVPIGTAIACGEYEVLPCFIIPMLVSLVLAAAINLPTRKIKINMNVRQTFVIVASAWVFISLLGAMPLYFSGYYPRFTDAFFESVSSFSTTGATVCTDVEALPRSINLWRCLGHWLGGMGVVTLTVAILPLLGVGGFQLIKAETTGPEKGKVTARITTTAKILWLIYFGLTALETILLKIAGMDFIDALSHAFSTFGTGGFSTRNASVGAYNSVSIDMIITFFLFLSGINFSLYFYIFARKFSEVKDNSELKAYIGIVLISTIFLAFCIKPVYGTFGKSLRYSSFQVLTITTTAGFATADFLQWPSTAQFIIFLLFFVGGCSGSTGGGIKVVRWVILFKQINNETKRMLHPHGVFSIRLNNKVGRKDVVFNVAAFMSLYFILIAVTTVVGCIGQLDIFSAFTGAVSMVGNIGPGFGLLGPSYNYAFLPGFVKWWYCFAMLAGRLELYTMIIFFIPSFWKK